MLQFKAMELFSQALKENGNLYDIIHFETNDFSNLEENYILKTHGICFYQRKIILVKDRGKDFWTIPGGTKEPGEDSITSFCREIKEETNCQVTKAKPLSYQKVQLGNDNFFIVFNLFAK